MLRVNYKIEYGEVKYRQTSDNRIYTIKIHWANALCAFIHHRKDNEGTKWADLVAFFADEQHIKNCEKSWDGDCLDFLMGKVTSIKLNLYYQESKTLLKHFVKAGHKVTCYYKEPKKK